ncbi:MAG: hypothetical protein C0522_14895, partial [Rhodocyclaceae bacterium]|nr:hypothetical protein [Rhodocyclaceae bacterium]
TWSDRAHAELTLDDGRRILVRLSGSAGVTAEGIGAVITIDLGDDVEAVASMSPEEIRARLRLLPEHGLRWEAHWCDAELSEQAQRQAYERAFECLDRESDGEAADPALPAAQRRETMLHRLVKEIIEMRARLQVPAVGQPGDEEGDRAQRSLDALWETARPSEWLKLEEVRSEQAFAGLVPDLQCRARAESDDFELDNLVIEVVVSNPVSEQKLALLREAGAAVLAIELQRAGGRVTRAQLEQVVVEDLKLKRWLLHPLLSNAAQLHPKQLPIELSVKRDSRSRADLVQQIKRSRPGPGNDELLDISPNTARALAAAHGQAEQLRLYREALLTYLRIQSAVGNANLESAALAEQAQAAASAWWTLRQYAAMLNVGAKPGGADAAFLFDLAAVLLTIQTGQPLWAGQQTA